jgi:hypothetical protein
MYAAVSADWLVEWIDEQEFEEHLFYKEYSIENL